MPVAHAGPPKSSVASSISATVKTASSTSSSVLITAPSASTAAPPPPALPPVSADDASEAKRHFDTGLKLYAATAYRGALTEFEASYRLNARPSALRNIAQCHRDLQEFAAAYDAYQKLLEVHGAQLSPKELETIDRALKDLESVTGTIALMCSEPDAAVQLDGRAVGTTPLGKPFRADVGPHKLHIFKSGFEAVEKDVTIVASESLALTVALKAEVKTGHVMVREEDGREVHVLIDDVDVGAAPWSGDLPPGPHSIEIKSDLVAAPKRTIEVVDKMSLDVVLVATPLRGRLRIETLGGAGEISIDGKKVGTGVWEGELAPGTYEISVAAAGFEPYKHLVAVTRGQTFLEPVTLVRTAPVVVAPAIVAPPSFRGLYGRLSIFGAAPISGGSDLAASCSPDGMATCEATAPEYAIGPTLHIGYSFDWLGLELVSAFMVETPAKIDRSYKGKPGDPSVTSDGTTLGGGFQRLENHRLQSIGAFFGLGARVTSKDDAVRFTFGASLGGAYRSTSYERTVGGDDWKPADVHFFSPAFMLDAGILLGSTPGTKLTLGAAAWIELSGTQQTEDGGLRPGRETIGGVTYPVQIPSGPVTLTQGAHIFFGPTLGLQFGR